MSKEKRTVNIKGLSRRDATDEKPLKISGYAAVFNSRANIGDFFTEQIAPGAFKETLEKNDDIRALFNHNWDKPLGRTKAGTLRLLEDETGLKFDIDLPDTTAARDLAISMERGDVDQCSFLFNPTSETWDYETEPATRTINSAELFEISVVTIPAYDDTSAQLTRSKDIDKEAEQRVKLIKKINQMIGDK